jgi:PKD repeat protein
VKTVLGTLLGLISGAVAMYFTSFVDRVIKPPKPVANFAVHASGLTVSFENRSIGGDRLRWDFGDGSPLEFVSNDQAVIKHTYAKPGNYTVRLAVTNLVNETNERAVTIEVKDPKPDKPTTEAPMIADITVRPPGKAGQPVYAPATFQFEATADNSSLIIWDFGDGKGVQTGDSAMQWTFEKPGTYTVKVCAFNGKQKVEHKVPVVVHEAPTQVVRVSLTVTTTGTRAETRSRTVRTSRELSVARGAAQLRSIDQTLTATPGYEISRVEVRSDASRSRHVKDVVALVSADLRSVKVVGTVDVPPQPSVALLNEEILIVEQKKLPAVLDASEPFIISVPVPGMQTLRLPDVGLDWIEVQRKYSCVVKVGEEEVWRGPQLPQGVTVTLAGRNYRLTALQQNDAVEFRITTGEVAAR